MGFVECNKGMVWYCVGVSRYGGVSGVFFSGRRRHTRSSTVSWAGDGYKRQVDQRAGDRHRDIGAQHHRRAHRERDLGDRDQEGDCLLYTSDAADERSSVDLGGRRIIKKKNTAYSGRT